MRHGTHELIRGARVRIELTLYFFDSRGNLLVAYCWVCKPRWGIGNMARGTARREAARGGTATLVESHAS